MMMMTSPMSRTADIILRHHNGILCSIPRRWAGVQWQWSCSCWNWTSQFCRYFQNRIWGSAVQQDSIWNCQISIIITGASNNLIIVIVIDNQQTRIWIFRIINYASPISRFHGHTLYLCVSNYNSLHSIIIHTLKHKMQTHDTNCKNTILVTKCLHTWLASVLKTDM